MGISVVLLAYKEADNLKVLLPEIRREVEKCGEPYELLIVDTEVTQDDTPAVCAENGARYVNQREPGFGGAFRTAIAEAKEDKFLILDADGSHPPKYIPAIYEKFTKEHCDVVIGSRYTAGGVSNDAVSSRIMSHMLNFAYRIAIGVSAKDLSTDYRMYHTEELKKVTLECRNYDVLEEVLLKLKLNRPGKKLAVGEVPITFSKRMYGESKRQLIPYIISYLKTIVRLVGIRLRAK